jgi:hypothetical protein
MPAVSFLVAMLTCLRTMSSDWVFNSDVFKFLIEQSVSRNVYKTSVGELYGHTYTGKYRINLGVPGSMILKLTLNRFGRESGSGLASSGSIKIQW